MKRISFGIMVTLLSLGMLTFVFNIQYGKAQPSQIIVPDDYHTIQEAINNASSGDTIFVRSETYYENVVINKTISLIGERADSTIIDGNGTEVVVQLWYVENVIISNFTIKGGLLGIIFRAASNVTMRNIRLIDNKYSINFQEYYLFKHFVHDIDTSNTVNGKPIYYWIDRQNMEVPLDAGCVIIINGTNITVRNLNLTANWYSVWFFNTNNSLIENVNYSNSSSAICLESSHNNTLRHNTIANTSGGILLLYGSERNIIENNTLINNEDGIYLGSTSNNNRIYNNVVANNTNSGVFIENSVKNFIIKNTIAKNNYGIYMKYASNNTIYHNNFLNNTHQTYMEPPLSDENVWDNGYPSGGNFWNDHINVDLYSGPYQNMTGSDGISDISYNITEDNIDRYPLTGLFYDFETEWVDDTIINHIEVVSNSTVSNLIAAVLLDHYPPHLPVGTVFIELSVEGEVDTMGFCRVTIPRAIINGTYVVLIGYEEIPWSDYLEIPSYELLDSNTTHAYLYFTYNQTQQKNQIIIVPEYPSTAILLTITTLSLIIVMLLKRKKRYLL